MSAASPPCQSLQDLSQRWRNSARSLNLLQRNYVVMYAFCVFLLIYFLINRFMKGWFFWDSLMGQKASSIPTPNPILKLCIQPARSEHSSFSSVTTECWLLWGMDGHTHNPFKPQPGQGIIAGCFLYCWFHSDRSMTNGAFNMCFKGPWGDFVIISLKLNK